MSFSLHAPARGNTLSAAILGIPTPHPPLFNILPYRPDSLNQPYRFREALRSGGVLNGAICHLDSPEALRVFANSGFDWAFLDWEHTPWSAKDIAEVIKGIQYFSEGHTAAIVRLPSFAHEWMTWALDAGASGIIVPHTETAEQARQIIHHARFVFHGGLRSHPPNGMLPGLTDGSETGQTIPQIYSEHAAVIVQIESVKGCENAMEIAAVPGVDGLMIGTGDLRSDLSLPGLDGSELAFIRCMDLFLAAGKKHNKPMMSIGTHGLLEKRWVQGFRVFIMTSDVGELGKGLMGCVKDARERIEGALRGDGEC